MLEQSWKILRRRKQQQQPQHTQPSYGEAEESTPGSAQAAQIPLPHHAEMRSLSDIISPLMVPHRNAILPLDYVSATPRAPLPVPASPALSALPPAAALKSLTALVMPTASPSPSSSSSSSSSSLSNAAAAAPSASSVCVPGAPFSASSTLFKASLLHLRSLYFGQKQLKYSLHSNPLFQNLSVIYHLSACQQKVLETLRHVHVALYRSTHQGKWPRSTKIEEAALNAAIASSSNGDATNDKNASFDLMPLHFQLDGAVNHRTAFLAQLQKSQKHVWELLHATPVHVRQSDTRILRGAAQRRNECTQDVSFGSFLFVAVLPVGLLRF